LRDVSTEMYQQRCINRYVSTHTRDCVSQRQSSHPSPTHYHPSLTHSQHTLTHNVFLASCVSFLPHYSALSFSRPSPHCVCVCVCACVCYLESEMYQDALHTARCIKTHYTLRDARCIIEIAHTLRLETQQSPLSQHCPLCCRVMCVAVRRSLCCSETACVLQ